MFKFYFNSSERIHESLKNCGTEVCGYTFLCHDDKNLIHLVLGFCTVGVSGTSSPIGKVHGATQECIKDNFIVGPIHLSFCFSEENGKTSV